MKQRCLLAGLFCVILTGPALALDTQTTPVVTPADKKSTDEPTKHIPYGRQIAAWQKQQLELEAAERKRSVRALLPGTKPVLSKGGSPEEVHHFTTVPHLEQ